MIGYRIRRFLGLWADAGSTMRAFLLWSATNTVVAFGLLFSSFFLLLVMNAPGFQRAILFGYIGLAVAWIVSIFLIDTVYSYVDPASESGSESESGT
ncbi:MAG: hypothetical protein ABEJ85_06280 [Haloarculaceae archaeon]